MKPTIWRVRKIKEVGRKKRGGIERRDGVKKENFLILKHAMKKLETEMYRVARGRVGNKTLNTGDRENLFEKNFDLRLE